MHRAIVRTSSPETREMLQVRLRAVHRELLQNRLDQLGRIGLVVRNYAMSIFRH